MISVAFRKGAPGSGRRIDLIGSGRVRGLTGVEIKNQKRD